MLLIQQLTGGQVIFLLMNPLDICPIAVIIRLYTNIFNNIPDNIFTLQQWCSTTFPEAKEQLEHMYREVYFCLLVLF